MKKKTILIVGLAAAVYALLFLVVLFSGGMGPEEFKILVGLGLFGSIALPLWLLVLRKKDGD